MSLVICAYTVNDTFSCFRHTYLNWCTHIDIYLRIVHPCNMRDIRIKPSLTTGHIFQLPKQPLCILNNKPVYARYITVRHTLVRHLSEKFSTCLWDHMNPEPLTGWQVFSGFDLVWCKKLFRLKLDSDICRVIQVFFSVQFAESWWLWSRHFIIFLTVRWGHWTHLNYPDYEDLRTHYADIRHKITHALSLHSLYIYLTHTPG